jgi:hypothetical protein
MSFIGQQAPFSSAVAGEQASLHRLVLHLTLFYIEFIVYLLISNPYYLENRRCAGIGAAHLKL